VKSWSRQYPQFVSTLTVQSAVAFLISGFSLVTAAFAIASVLIVSVLQKGKQIGILKSMGAMRAQIFRVFLLEGFGIAVVGASLGASAGCGLVMLLQIFKRPVSRPDAIPEALFPTELTWTLVGVAMLAAVISTVIAAALPARRAASMDPVQVMR
jgi:lipoprotein-releasing system permease protein